MEPSGSGPTIVVCPEQYILEAAMAASCSYQTDPILQAVHACTPPHEVGCNGPDRTEQRRRPAAEEATLVDPGIMVGFQCLDESLH